MLECNQTCKTCQNSGNNYLSCYDGYYYETISKSCKECLKEWKLAQMKMNVLLV